MHSKPQRNETDGEPGTAIYWQDPDGNQFEFWAPDTLPDGAMTDATDAGVGRISHATFESRDLERTADFFRRYCDLERVRTAGVANDTLVLRLASGSLIVYKLDDQLGGLTTGMGLRDAHTALCVERESFFPYNRRLWGGIPEWGADANACESDRNLPDAGRSVQAAGAEARF